MKYQVIFDVARDGYRGWWVFGVGIAMLAAGLLWDVLLRRWRRPHRFGRPACCFMLAFVLLTFAVKFPRYLQLRDALMSGRCEVVTGHISGFVAGVDHGGGPEQFVVVGQRFSYGKDVSSAGFNLTQPHGGPMRSGLSVRVTHWNGEIARLEIAKIR